MLLLAVLGVLVLGGSGCALFDCPTDSTAVLPQSQFIGELVHKSGADVEYRIVEVMPPGRYPVAGVDLTIGQTVAVHYVEGAHFLHQGSRYLVSVWAEGPSHELTSNVNTHKYRCEGVSATRHADGSAIDTGLFTRDGFRPWVAFAIGIPLLLIGWAIVHVLRDRRAWAQAARHYEESQADLPK